MQMKTVLAFRTAHLSHIIAMAPAIQSFNGEDTSASDAIAAVRIRLFLFFALYITLLYMCVCVSSSLFPSFCRRLAILMTPHMMTRCVRVKSVKPDKPKRQNS